MSPALRAVIVGMAVSQVAIVVTTVWLHRTLAHRAMTVHPWLTRVFRVVTWITTGIRPRQWIAVHRRHHAYTDVEGDPHSPVLLGTLRVQLTNLWLYRKAARDPRTTVRYARDLPSDRWDQWLFDHALLGLGLGIGVLVALFGWRYGLLAAGVHTVTYLALNSAVNALGHAIGSRPFDNTAHNLQWLALLTAGEGLHNNHHAMPTSARLAMGPHQIDPGWWVISAFHKLGWVEPRRLRSVPLPTSKAA
jgi:stearoyl-CoA desaturase (delta-9 desaturase)